MIKQETQVEVEIAGRKQRYCCDPASSFADIWQGMQAIIDELKACEAKALASQQTGELLPVDDNLKEISNG